MEPNNFSAVPAVPSANMATEVPEEILKKIKASWIAALVSGGITLVITLIAMSGTPVLGFSAWELIDVALIFGLAFGIYKKSRACAVIMLIYFIIAKVILIFATGNVTGIPLAIAFLYCFWQGVDGTFAYHKLKKKQQFVPPIPG